MNGRVWRWTDGGVQRLTEPLRASCWGPPYLCVPVGRCTVVHRGGDQDGPAVARRVVRFPARSAVSMGLDRVTCQAGLRSPTAMWVWLAFRGVYAPSRQRTGVLPGGRVRALSVLAHRVLSRRLQRS